MTVHRGRGQRLFQESDAPVWDRYADPGGIRFAINMDHPLISALTGRLSSADAAALRVLLESVAASLPVEMIYSDYSTAPREVRQVPVEADGTAERLQRLNEALFPDGRGDPETFRRIIRSTRLFDGQAEAVERYLGEAFG